MAGTSMKQEQAPSTEEGAQPGLSPDHVKTQAKLETVLGMVAGGFVSFLEVRGQELKEWRSKSAKTGEMEDRQLFSIFCEHLGTGKPIMLKEWPGRDGSFQFQGAFKRGDTILAVIDSLTRDGEATVVAARRFNQEA